MPSNRPTLRYLLIAPLVFATVRGPGLVLPCAACLQHPGTAPAARVFSPRGCDDCERERHAAPIDAAHSKRHERTLTPAGRRGSCHTHMLLAGTASCCGTVAGYPAMIPARTDTAPAHGAMIFATANTNPRPRQRVASAIAPCPPPDIAPPLYLLHETLII